jgi:hypothetical protein
LHDLRKPVEGGLPGDRKFGGSLGTTFLLAMAMPMVILPIERILKPSTEQSPDAISDDTEIDPRLAEIVAEGLSERQAFGNAPFFQPGAWSYIPRSERFSLAGAWPTTIIDQLCEDAAFRAAEKASAKQVLICLRNALAHGGVAYLDKDGHQTGGPAAMLAFVSTLSKMDKVTSRHVVDGCRVLRITQDDFACFLGLWADWLGQHEIRSALAA